MKKIIKITLTDSNGDDFVFEGEYQNQLIQQFFGMGSKPNPRTGVVERFHTNNNVIVIALGSTSVCEQLKGYLQNIPFQINF